MRLIELSFRDDAETVERLLAASERRGPTELAALQAFLAEAGLRSTLIDSPLRNGFGAEKVKILRIEAARDGIDFVGCSNVVVDNVTVTGGGDDATIKK